MLQLKINGRLFDGWTEASITRGMAQMASSFELKVTDRWENVKWEIAAFDGCELLWKGEPILTGYIDSNSVSYDAESHQITLTGRSKTCDLVDCSAASAQFKNQWFEQIATALAAPFGVDVVLETSTGTSFESWKPDDGVQIFEALEKLARLRGLLLMDNGNGNLVITRAGIDRISTPLELGVNIKAGSGQFNVVDRFSDYIVKGQRKGGDNISPNFAAHATGIVKDSRVPRYRPMQVQAEDQTDTGAAFDRAQWEANVRFGQSQRLSYQVQGWEHANGLWQPNRIVAVKDSMLGLQTDLIISSVVYRLSDQGSETQLTLAHPKAFANKPIDVSTPAKAKPGTVKGGIVWQELG